MIILGISAFYHDSAAVLLNHGTIVAAAQEERFTRVKHDAAFPKGAVRFCLNEAGIRLVNVDAVVFYDKPLLTFERLLETYYAFAPKGLKSFLSAMPVWMKEKLFMRKTVLKELAATTGERLPYDRLLFSEHHLSHAASAFFPSPYDEAAILTIDGVGEWATASIAHGKGNTITVLKELHFPHSLGLLYSAFTSFLGFKVNSGEYKMMGLAPYGNPKSERVARYVQLIREKLVTIYDDGSLRLNQEYFDYATGLSMVREQQWGELFGMSQRAAESELQAEHCDLALAIQQVTEEIVLKMAGEARRITGASKLCLAGGVALNCVVNGRLLRSGLFDDIWIQPAAGDAGGALGAALAGHHIFFGSDRVSDGTNDRMTGAFLGPDYNDSETARMVRKFGAVFSQQVSFEDVCTFTADRLAEGAVIGWFQGKMEWGPRALGNRSIIADPRNPQMQQKLNLKIKQREGFRPFAPSVLIEDVQEYFELNGLSPYMLFTADLQEARRRPLPAGFSSDTVREKLSLLRSDIPSVTHVDFSARIQTVHRETNQRYWQLINAFKRKTGYGVIVNTSFNLRGEPIVMTPEDAYVCFMRTGMDYLVIGNLVFDKAAQPEWHDVADWRKKFQPD